MRFAKGIQVTAAAVLLASLSSCSLLPEETEYANKPVIRSYTQAEYSLAYAQYGDVTLSETISVKYMAVTTETLAYPVGGEYYGETFVQKGDLVQKGQLLAELDLSGLEQTIENEQMRIAETEMQLRHLYEQRDLAVANRRRALSTLNEAEAREWQSAEELAAQYDRSIETASDSLAVARLRLAEYETALSQRRLYAGIDGAVTYVRNVETGARSVEGETFIRLADATNSVFSGMTANYELLLPGTIVSVYCRKEYMDAKVVTAEELGLPASEPDNKGRRTVYFQLLAPNAALETGDRGTLIITIAERKDVLYIPTDALHMVGENTFVYSRDELGLKRMQIVQAGLIAAKEAEILSGLQQGDNVIID